MSFIVCTTDLGDPLSLVTKSGQPFKDIPPGGILLRDPLKATEFPTRGAARTAIIRTKRYFARRGKGEPNFGGYEIVALTVAAQGGTELRRAYPAFERPGESSFRDKARRTFQPIVLDQDGTPRFKENAIVRLLLSSGSHDLNTLARIEHITDEDRAQFAQLIGYSVNGWGELNYVSLRDARIADALGDELAAVKKGGRS